MGRWAALGLALVLVLVLVHLGRPVAVVGLCAQVLAASATLVVRGVTWWRWRSWWWLPWPWACRALAPCLGCARWLVATLLGCCLCWWRWVLFLVVALALGLPCSCTLPGPCCGLLGVLLVLVLWVCAQVWPCWLPAPRWWAGGGLLPTPLPWCWYP